MKQIPDNLNPKENKEYWLSMVGPKRESLKIELQVSGQLTLMNWVPVYLQHLCVKADQLWVVTAVVCVQEHLVLSKLVLPSLEHFLAVLELLRHSTSWNGSAWSPEPSVHVSLCLFASFSSFPAVYPLLSFHVHCNTFLSLYHVYLLICLPQLLLIFPLSHIGHLIIKCQFQSESILFLANLYLQIPLEWASFIFNQLLLKNCQMLLQWKAIHSCNFFLILHAIFDAAHAVPAGRDEFRLEGLGKMEVKMLIPQQR